MRRFLAVLSSLAVSAPLYSLTFQNDQVKGELYIDLSFATPKLKIQSLDKTREFNSNCTWEVYAPPLSDETTVATVSCFDMTEWNTDKYAFHAELEMDSSFPMFRILGYSQRDAADNPFPNSELLNELDEVSHIALDPAHHNSIGPTIVQIAKMAPEFIGREIKSSVLSKESKSIVLKKCRKITILSTEDGLINLEISLDYESPRLRDKEVIEGILDASRMESIRTNDLREVIEKAIQDHNSKL